MPVSLFGRIFAAGYLLAVVAAALLWVVQEAAHFAVITTMVLTLPFSPLVYVIVVMVGLSLTSISAGPVVVAALILVLFPGVALANILLTRAAWHASRRRRLGRAADPTTG